MLVRDGVILVKYWFSVSDAEQAWAAIGGQPAVAEAAVVGALTVLQATIARPPRYLTPSA